MTTKNVWIYSRTSGKSDKEDTVDGTGKISLELQEAKSRELAESHGTIVGVSSDNDFSGRTYPAGISQEVLAADLDYVSYMEERVRSKSKHVRPGLAELMNSLSEVDVLIVRDITRLCRPFKDSGLLGYLFQRLRHANVSVLLHDGSALAPTDEMARMIKRLALSFEDQSVEEKYLASKESIQAKREKGDLYRAIRCYGYTTDARTVTGDSAKLQTIRKIFEDYLEDKTMSQILEGPRTSDSSKTWEQRSIRVILRNPIYCGMHALTSGELIKANYMVHVETPVTISQFRQVAAKLKKRSSGPKTKGNVHPLSGLLKCGYCGDNMVVNMRNSGDRYVCKSIAKLRQDHTKPCRYATIVETYHTRGLSTYTQMVARGTGLLDSLRKMLAATILDHLRANGGSDQIKQRLVKIDEETASLSELSSGLYQMFKDKAINFAQYSADSKQCKLDLDQLGAEREEILEEETASAINDTLDWQLAISGKLPRMTEQDLFRLTFDHVRIYGWHVVLVMQDGQEILLPRQVKLNQRPAPVGTTHYRLGITSRPEVTYSYQEEGKESIICDTPSLLVKTVGKPTQPKKENSRLKADPQGFKAIYNLPLPESHPDRL
jgi:DNA invertase Pin-like site-specific DNA recombinase